MANSEVVLFDGFESEERTEIGQEIGEWARRIDAKVGYLRQSSKVYCVFFTKLRIVATPKIRLVKLSKAGIPQSIKQNGQKRLKSGRAVLL